MTEPDLFAAKLNETAAPAAGPDPFASKPTNPASASNDPFSSTGNNGADSDPFGGKMKTEGEVDPFSSQDGVTDPFSCSPPSSDLAVVSGLLLQCTGSPGYREIIIFNPFRPGATFLSISLGDLEQRWWALKLDEYPVKVAQATNDCNYFSKHTADILQVKAKGFEKLS